MHALLEGDRYKTYPLAWVEPGAGRGNLIDTMEKELAGDLNGKDDIGWTVLMWATMLGHLEVVQTLLKDARVDQYAQSTTEWGHYPCGSTALSIARISLAEGIYDQANDEPATHIQIIQQLTRENIAECVTLTDFGVEWDVPNSGSLHFKKGDHIFCDKAQFEAGSAHARVQGWLGEHLAGRAAARNAMESMLELSERVVAYQVPLRKDQQPEGTRLMNDRDGTGRFAPKLISYTDQQWGQMRTRSGGYTLTAFDPQAHCAPTWQVVGLAQKSMLHLRCADAGCPHGCATFDTIGLVEAAVNPPPKE